MQGGNEFAEWPLFVDGHDLVAHFITGSVQRNGEPQRAPESSEFFESGHVAGGRDGDVACSDVKGVLIHDDGECRQQVVHVGQGFSHPHEDEIVYSRAANLFGGNNLADDFSCGEVTC